MKKISDFLSENFILLLVKFSVYLNRLVFVMFVNEQNAQIILHMPKVSSTPFLSSHTFCILMHLCM